MNLKAGAVASIVAVAAGIAVVRFAAAPKPATAFVPIPTPQGPLERPRRSPAPSLVVYVAGSVARPGVYALSGSARTVDALHSAGGPVAGADLVRVNLAEPLTDGEEIVVPAKSDPPSDDTLSAAPRTKHHASKRRGRKRAAHHRKRAHPKRAIAAPADGTDPNATATDEPSEPVDINRADESELETLPGIGASLAERIVAFRELNGPFASYDELLDVAGMTQKRLDDIQPFLSSI